MNVSSRGLRLARQVLPSLGLVFLISALCSPALAGRKHIYSDLYNIDLVLPPPIGGRLPNDLHIIIYGIFPDGVNSVIDTFQNEKLGKVQLQDIVYTSPWLGDPLDPGFGYDRLELTYQSAPGTDPFQGANNTQHFGVHLKPCCYHVHIVVFWTLDGQPQAPWGATVPHVHIIKMRVNGSWLVVVSNPTAQEVWLQQPRIFRPSPTHLPRLAELVTGIQPSTFGAIDWEYLTHPALSNPIEPGRSLTFRIDNSSDPETPIVFQVGVLSSASGSPQAVVTDRAAQEFDADSNGDGVIKVEDYSRLRLDWLKTSVDLNP